MKTRQQKAYPLQIRDCAEYEGGSHPLWVYSKGHHEPEEFAKAANAYVQEEFSGVTIFERFCCPYDVRDVRHEYWRCVPVGPGEYGQHFLMPTNGPSPGAFPVTVVDA